MGARKSFYLHLLQYYLIPSIPELGLECKTHKERGIEIQPFNYLSKETCGVEFQFEIVERKTPFFTLLLFFNKFSGFS